MMKIIPILLSAGLILFSGVYAEPPSYKGKTLDEWVKQFNEGGRSRGLAATSLGKIGAPAIPALRKALSADDWETRHAACYAFTVMGEVGKDAAPDIAKLVHDKNENVRLHAGMALSKMGGSGALALGKALDGGNAEGKIAVMNMLIRMKTKGKAALPAVRKLLQAEDEAVRKKAEVLAKILSGEW